MGKNEDIREKYSVTNRVGEKFQNGLTEALVCRKRNVREVVALDIQRELAQIVMYRCRLAPTGYETCVSSITSQQVKLKFTKTNGPYV